VSLCLPRYLIVNFKKKRRPWSLPSGCFRPEADIIYAFLFVYQFVALTKI
jgi:hypothetical protein